MEVKFTFLEGVFIMNGNYFWIDYPKGDIYRVTKWVPELDHYRMGVYHIGADVECVRNNSGRACIERVIEPAEVFLDYSAYLEYLNIPV